MTITLEIGGYRLELREQAGRKIWPWPREAFQPFEVEGGRPADLSFEVSVVEALPEIPHGELLFDAGKGLWKLFEHADGYFIETWCPDSGKALNRAVISKDYARSRVHTLLAADGTWPPTQVINPLAELCLLTRLARDGGLMLHAAGVDWRGSGLVFTGPSGAGKSTLSGFFVDRGAMILNDERVIVRGAQDAPVVHGTPWCGSNPIINKASAPLLGLYFIRHGVDGNKISKLPAMRAVSLCVKQAFLPYWDTPAMEATMTSAEKLVALTGRLEYAFLNEASAVDLVLRESGLHAKDLASDLA